MLKPLLRASRNSPLSSRSVALGVVALLACAAPQTPGFRGGEAQAQGAGGRSWVNPDVIALREEVERLGREVERLRGGGVASSGDSSQPVGADAYVRLDALETQLRTLIGRLEQVEFEQRRVQTEQAQKIQDLSLRLAALEQAIGGGDPAALGDPNAIGLGGEDGGAGSGDGSGAGLDGGLGGAASGGSGAADGGLGGATLGGARSGDPLASGGGGLAGRGAPPRSLGTIPGTGAGGASGGSTQFGGSLAPTASGASPEGDAALKSAIGALRSGSFDDAERQLTTFIQTYPNHNRVGEAKHWLGETYFVRQRYQQAAATFLSSFREHPDGPKAPDSLLRLGMTLAQLNQRDEACLTFNQVGQRYPNASPNTRRKAQIEAKRNGCR